MWSDRTSTEDLPPVETLTKDGLRVDVDITVRWRISPSKVVDLYRQFPGLDWNDKAIIPIIRESVRNLIVNFTAIETIEKRAIIGTVLAESLTKPFTKEQTLRGAILVDAVNLRRITLPDNFVNAIESKLAA